MVDKELVISLAQERIDELNGSKEANSGLFIVDVDVTPRNDIFLYLDAEKGGVSIQECVSVSRNIEHNLDRDKEDFSLEVSSAGLSSPFRVLKQYQKNIGNEVKIQTVEHGKSVEGVLKSADENRVVIEWKEKRRVEGKKKKEWVTEERSFTYEEIKETKLIISF